MELKNNSGDEAAQMVAAAQELAREAHAGQFDKSGQPYIEHVRRVAEGVEAAGCPAAVQAAAWLHDVVEDTSVTLGDLAAFPDAVVAAVDALTRRPDEGDAYYARVAADPLAVWVKRADMADNTDPERLAALPSTTADRLRTKYAHAESLIQHHLDAGVR